MSKASNHLRLLEERADKTVISVDFWSDRDKFFMGFSGYEFEISKYLDSNQKKDRDLFPEEEGKWTVVPVEIEHYDMDVQEAIVLFSKISRYKDLKFSYQILYKTPHLRDALKQQLK